MRPVRAETKAGLQRQRNLWLNAAILMVSVELPSTFSYHTRAQVLSCWAERSPQWAVGPLLSARARLNGQQDCRRRLQADLAFPLFSPNVVRVQHKSSGFDWSRNHNRAYGFDRTAPQTGSSNNITTPQ